jgi:TPR repeat protein
LEFFYTKQAAELGLTEAQHNLGCMYMEGEITKYDSLKALSWFSYAGAAGFHHSMVQETSFVLYASIMRQNFI